MTLQSRLQDKITTTFTRLNASGKNLGGREAVEMVIFAKTQAGNNPMKKTDPTVSEVGTPVNLVVIDLELGDIRRPVDGVLTHFGDARMEIACLVGETLLTRNQLLGKGLPAGQQLRYRIDGELYTIAPGQLRDSDGLTWKLILVGTPI